MDENYMTRIDVHETLGYFSSNLTSPYSHATMFDKDLFINAGTTSSIIVNNDGSKIFTEGFSKFYGAHVSGLD